MIKEQACSHISSGEPNNLALEKHHKSVQSADKAIKKVDILFKFNLECISIEMTGNKSDFYGNSKLMSFGFEKQHFSISKDGKVIKLNAFGITLGIFNQFEELYKFAIRTNSTMISVGERIKSQINDEEYFQELKKAMDNAKSLKPSNSVSNISQSEMN